jgi:hypothetical protein
MEKRREIVLLCAEDDDFDPTLVRLVDAGIRRGLPLEVVVLSGPDPMPAVLFAHPGALLVLLRSPALHRDQLRAVRRGFAAFCRPTHALWEVWLEDAERPARVVSRIERELSARVTERPRDRPGKRRLMVSDAATVARSMAEWPTVERRATLA